MRLIRSLVIVAVFIYVGYFVLWQQLVQYRHLATVFSWTGLHGGSIDGAVLVPHFTVTKDQRTQLWQELGSKFEPERVVLVSIDHFNVGPTDISTTKRSWQFQGQSPRLDDRLEAKLVSSKVASELDTELVNEHGLTQILPELVSTWSDAKYTEITIKDTATREEVNQLYDLINTECPHCLLVASVDWSHYNVASLAALHDVQTERAVVSKDSELAWQAETDSPQTMYLLTRWARDHQLTWEQFAHSNSGADAKSFDSETTSYMIGDFAADNKPAAITPTTTFIVGGDIMFDRAVNHLFVGRQRAIFDQLGRRVFRGTDLALVNLEGPISATDINDDTNPNNLVFNFPPESADTLKYIGVNAVSLANNHTLNQGSKGENSTLSALQAAGMAAIGHQGSFDSQSVYKVKGPVPMTVITIDTVDQYDGQAVVTAIKEAKTKGQFVLVMPHWGYEYQTHHSQGQANLAKEWIAAGAGLIIGGHPHVVQDIQLVDGVPVVYSLGNFVFDQNFSAETQRGLLVAGSLTTDQLQLSFYPTKIINSQPELLLGQERQERLRELLANSFTLVGDDTILLNLTK